MYFNATHILHRLLIQLHNTNWYTLVDINYVASLYPCRFNLVAYNNSVKKWQEKLVPCSSENVAEASEWLAHLRPGGCSCLLDAVKVKNRKKRSGTRE